MDHPDSDSRSDWDRELDEVIELASQPYLFRDLIQEYETVVLARITRLLAGGSYVQVQPVKIFKGAINTSDKINFPTHSFSTESSKCHRDELAIILCEHPRNGVPHAKYLVASGALGRMPLVVYEGLVYAVCYWSDVAFPEHMDLIMIQKERWLPLYDFHGFSLFGKRGQVRVFKNCRLCLWEDLRHLILKLARSEQ